MDADVQEPPVRTERVATPTTRATQTRIGASRHNAPETRHRASLRRCSRPSNDRAVASVHDIDRWINLEAQSVALREPTLIVVGKPFFARCILPNQQLQQQIDSDRLI
jgi:hypothetical protein